jgi:hypothetical protein|tara:strand:+ start:1751 stop:2383 length:633 start_codon:yes stop_codon:yes gene_type:complete
MKKLEKNWQGVVPQYFPELTKYIEKEFEPKKLKKKHLSLFKDEISIYEQTDFFIKVVFSLARQIPSDWIRLKNIIPNDYFINFYIRDFVVESYITYLEWCNGIEPPETDIEEGPTSYDGIVLDVYKELGRLYKSSQNMTNAWNNCLKYLENNKYNKLYKNAKACALKDSEKIVSANSKKPSKLKWEDVLYGGKKTNKHCNLLREYISKKY